MSSASFKEALDLALELPADERAALAAHDLLISLDGPADADAAQAWEAEITRRLDELERGQVQTVDADKALSRIDKNLSRRR
jgi:putative addiction module component (TIGR02574 family)